MESFVMALGNLSEEVVLSQHWRDQRSCYRGRSILLLSTPGDKLYLMLVELVQGIPKKSHNILEPHIKSIPLNTSSTNRKSLDNGKSKEEPASSPEAST